MQQVVADEVYQANSSQLACRVRGWVRANARTCVRVRQQASKTALRGFMGGEVVLIWCAVDGE
jgi:hypothetical protein